MNLCVSILQEEPEEESDDDMGFGLFDQGHSQYDLVKFCGSLPLSLLYGYCRFYFCAGYLYLYTT